MRRVCIIDVAADQGKNITRLGTLERVALATCSRFLVRVSFETRLHVGWRKRSRETVNTSENPGAGRLSRHASDFLDLVNSDAEDLVHLTGIRQREAFSSRHIEQNVGSFLSLNERKRD